MASGGKGAGAPRSRTYYAAKNSAFGVIGKCAGLLASFASRTVFIHTLGKYYLGVSGLYSNVLSVLSLAELGFGSAMTFALYAPVAAGDDERVRQLLGFYRKVYRGVALAVALLGLALTPFLQHVVSGADMISLGELRLYFLIYLANTVASYFVTYKYGLLNAMQGTYVTTNVETVTNLACAAAQIAALALTSDFLAYLLAQTATLVLSRFAISAYLNRRWPILRERPAAPLPKAERDRVLGEVRGLAVHQFSSVAVHATDNIIISAIPALGVAVVGAVSNYSIIISAASGLALALFNGLSAGFGNLAASGDRGRFREAFEEANLANFWVYGVCTACFFTLLSPFVELWAGPDYLIDGASLALILADFYLQGQCTVYNNARIAKGNFNMDKWWSLLQALVNLVVSVACALELGLVGVYIGTVTSRLVFVVSRPCCTWRFLFGTSPAGYFRTLAKYLLAAALATAACSLACAPILAHSGAGPLLAAAAVCLAVSNLLFLALFGRGREFRAVMSRLSGLLERRG